MANVKLDLKAYRCPDATIKMSRVLNQFSGDKALSGLVVNSIEPSLQRNMLGIINEGGMNIKIARVSTREITDQDKQLWGDMFDEDDWGDCSTINTFFLEKFQEPL